MVRGKFLLVLLLEPLVGLPQFSYLLVHGVLTRLGTIHSDGIIGDLAMVVIQAHDHTLALLVGVTKVVTKRVLNLGQENSLRVKALKALRLLVSLRLYAFDHSLEALLPKLGLEKVVVVVYHRCAVPPRLAQLVVGASNLANSLVVYAIVL